MIRVVTVRRLRRLEAAAFVAQAQIERGLACESELRKRLELLRQALDYHARDAAEWKGRASRLIDQIGIASGALTAPAMSEQPPTPQGETRRVMAALGRQSLTVKPPVDPQPSDPSARVLGVDADAAAAAVAGVLHP